MKTRQRTFISITLLLAIGFSGVLSHIALATFGRVGPLSTTPTLVACVVIAIGFVSPLWISPSISNGAARQLFYVAWRLGILLPAVWLTGYWDGSERNCFITALLACYFVALPLESWLLIREVRESDT